MHHVLPIGCYFIVLKIPDLQEKLGHVLLAILEQTTAEGHGVSSSDLTVSLVSMVIHSPIISSDL